MVVRRTGFTLFLLVSALSPFMTAHGEEAASGLLISRTSSERWEIRAVGGAAGQSFSGVVEASVPFRSVNGVSLEQGDAAGLSSPNLLSATFEIGSGDSDGVNFSVPGNAELCLRDTGSTGVKFYRGASLDDAILVSAPVSLTGAGACGEAA